MHLRRDRVIHHDHGAGAGYAATGALGRFAAFACAAASARSTAVCICSTVGRLHLNVTRSIAIKPSAAPEKNPLGQAYCVVPYRVPVMMRAAPPPAKLPPSAFHA